MSHTRLSALLGISLGVSVAAAPAPVVAQAQAAAAHPGLNSADVQFMSGMIMHHAQAVLMAGWAPTHGQDPRVRNLCARIVVSQRDEIGLMSTWLRDHHLAVPDTMMAMHPDMPGMSAHMMMPGMLTAAELARLDSARGTAWDRLFLTDMIRHHQGAITMVNDLFAAPGAPQDPMVFQFSSDVSSGQLAEIGRMQELLMLLPADTTHS